MGGSIQIGTSGWNYPHWKGPFYPEKSRPQDFLKFYCENFSTVEINNTFYHLPTKKAVQEWYRTTPKHFIFAVKGSRFITHMKKLKVTKRSISIFFRRIDNLKEKLGPILFQLPPRWNANPERLKTFLRNLPKGYSYAFEFRSPAWFSEEIYETLEKHKASFCIYDLAGTLSPVKTTSDIVYIRLHGPGGAYQGDYSRTMLNKWRDSITSWKDEGKSVYCYFDNDICGYAPKNAKELVGL